jgi:hypothetical protein
MSRKAGLSLEEKRRRALNYFYEKVSFHVHKTAALRAAVHLIVTRHAANGALTGAL